jgi:hypothetical protein
LGIRESEDSGDSDPKDPKPLPCTPAIVEFSDKHTNKIISNKIKYNNVATINETHSHLKVAAANRVFNAVVELLNDAKDCVHASRDNTLHVGI